MKRIHLAIEGIIAATLATAACTDSTAQVENRPVLETGDGGSNEAGTDASTAETRFATYADQAEFTCDAAQVKAAIDDLSPGTAVDYLELHRQSLASVDGGFEVKDPSDVAQAIVESRGTACATATDKTRCQSALDAARATRKVGWRSNGFGCGNELPAGYIVVYTRGDQVGEITTPAELATFLGPIDTLGDARYVGRASGQLDLSCTKPETDEVQVPDPGWRKKADGTFEIIGVVDSGGPGLYRARYTVSSTGTFALVDSQSVATKGGAVCGRRPDGLVDLACARADVGAYFAEVTWLEAAAVVAFRRVESELVALGAPTELIEAAQRAQADEIRHAREASALARRFGGAERPLEVAPPVERDAFAIALENAVEGCVRETYGALVAAYQAKRAGDPEVRRFFARIAADEANHAELSHEIAAWLEPQLTAGERARIAAAKAEALAELYAATETSPYARLAGLPPPEHTWRMLDGMQREILAA